MTNHLKEYFPLIRERADVLSDINNKPILRNTFNSWSVPRQEEFHNYPETYLHYAEAQSDTGIHINLLQKYVFIPLDIFQKTRHNKPIDNKVDAWLTFLSTEEPEAIEGLITACPEFKPMYDDIYELCRNTERVMDMFSKELQILDENTVQYMMDEMQETIDSQKGTIEEQSSTIQEQNSTIEKQKSNLQKLTSSLQQQKQTIAEKDLLIQQLQQQLKNRQP